MGNWMTVNGTSRPTLAAPAGERLRLRLINAANARVMTLLFKGAEAHLLAIDGQPLASPRKLAEPLVLPPGGRADIGLRRGLEQVIVAIDIDGEPLELAFIDRAVEAEPAPEVEPEAEGEGEAAGESAEDDKGEGQIDAPAETPAETPIEAHIEPDTGDFAPLPANPLPDTLDVSTALAVSLVMEGGADGGMKGAVVGGRHLSLRELVEHGMTWAMNGIAGLAEEPLVTVERGRTVALTVDNKTAWAHALHLHGHHVRVVEEDGRETGDPVWRDTVLIAPQAAVTLAFLADNPGKWMLQCHVLEHGEAGLVTWFEVT
jgi:FtsP/CotA-like multicopper oxidase with cupredoxin domain